MIGFSRLQNRLVMGIGLSSRGMAFCVADAIEEPNDCVSFGVLEFWENPTNIDELKAAIEKHRKAYRYALAVPDESLRLILDPTESWNFLGADEINITTKIAGGLIASTINQKKLAIYEEHDPLLDRVLEQDFLKPEGEESPAADALMYGLGMLIYLAQTQAIKQGSLVGAYLDAPISFGDYTAGKARNPSYAELNGLPSFRLDRSRLGHWGNNW